MSLQHALLGLLSYKPATGYELKSVFSESIRFFWNATLPQIYRTLNQMEEAGWLDATVEQQEGKPNRKVYSLTSTGSQEFLRWLREPPEIPQPKYPMLIKIFFGNRLEPDQLRTLLHQWREYHAKALEGLEKEVRKTIEHYAVQKKVPQDAAYWAMTLDFGEMHARMVLAWCDKALATLAQNEAKRHSKKASTSPRGRKRVPK
jgi:DNA-binding PadR family transcriptional regulator